MSRISTVQDYTLRRRGTFTPHRKSPQVLTGDFFLKKPYRIFRILCKLSICKEIVFEFPNLGLQSQEHCEMTFIAPSPGLMIDEFEAV
jgi:hypothetical protein